MNQRSNESNVLAVRKWLQDNPGTWTYMEIAEATGRPKGTVSSVLTVLVADTLEHRGAGVYGFNQWKGQARGYSWRSSFPEGCVTEVKKYPRKKRKAQKEQAPETMTLIRSVVAPDVWRNGTTLYRLVEVEIQIVEVT